MAEGESSWEAIHLYGGMMDLALSLCVVHLSSSGRGLMCAVGWGIDGQISHVRLVSQLIRIPRGDDECDPHSGGAIFPETERLQTLFGLGVRRPELDGRVLNYSRSSRLVTHLDLHMS